MRLLIYFLGLSLFLSCSDKKIDKQKKESIALENIVYLRTEGLMLLEKLVDHCPTNKDCMVGMKIMHFYSDTQPSLIGLCENKELNLSMSTYHEINSEVERLIQDSSSYYEFLLEKLLTNLHNQKSFYLQVLEDQELSNLHYYTLDSYLQMVCFIEDYKHLLANNYVAQ